MSESENNVKYNKTEKNESTGGGDKKLWRIVEENLVALVQNTSIAKLFLVFITVLYGIMIFSKGKKGISGDDLWIFIIFNFFAYLFFCFIKIATCCYVKYLKKDPLFIVRVIRKKFDIILFVFHLIIIGLLIYLFKL